RAGSSSIAVLSWHQRHGPSSGPVQHSRDGIAVKAFNAKTAIAAGVRIPPPHVGESDSQRESPLNPSYLLKAFVAHDAGLSWRRKSRHGGPSQRRGVTFGMSSFRAKTIKYVLHQILTGLTQR